MFATKPLFPNSNPSNLHLPPISKNFRRKFRPPPTPSYPSMSAKAAHLAENVSALKAKYTDYTTWLKTSNRHNREPALTQELLKNSLCQMGIDSIKADQLVSTCSWYVYQFQKDLKIDPEKKQKKHKKKSKKSMTIKDNTDDSTITFQDDSFSSNRLPLIRNNHSILSEIHVSNSSTSPRFRRVDFDNEQIKNSNPISPSSHWRSAFIKTRTLQKLLPISTKSSNNTNSSIDLDLSSSSSPHGLIPPGHKRSILRKQASLSSSSISTELNNRKIRSRILTPSSPIIDNIPLGTQSQRLFGGSEYFAQIMNELEQQKE